MEAARKYAPVGYRAINSTNPAVFGSAMSQPPALNPTTARIGAGAINRK
jgi:hypothetical protein